MKRFLVVIAAVLVLGWLAAAFWFQFGGAMRWGLLAGLGALAVWLVVLWSRRRPVGRWLVLIALMAAGWWATIRPSDTRNWDDDVSRGVTATIEGDRVILHDVRDFDWRTTTDYTARWEDRSYDLSQLQSVDLVTSVWDSPHIAHTLLSFGFADGQHVVFSGEIRREKGEEFSSFGGFFKQFELVLVAADEHDIIRLRTDARRESVSLWRLTTTAEQRRAMFLALVEYGNGMKGNPRWYHTLWTNCTTLPWLLARRMDAQLWPDWRVLASGHIADYLKEVGFISADQTPDVVRLAPTDGRTETGAAYSRLIRGQ